MDLKTDLGGVGCQACCLVLTMLPIVGEQSEVVSLSHLIESTGSTECRPSVHPLSVSSPSRWQGETGTVTEGIPDVRLSLRRSDVLAGLHERPDKLSPCMILVSLAGIL